MNALTWREQAAQLRGVRAIDLLDENRKFDPGKARNLMPDGIGFIAQPGDFCHPVGLTRDEVRAFVSDVQTWLQKETRPGLPAIVHEECLSGVTMRGAVIYPQMLALASTWNPALAETMTREISAEMRSLGISAGLSPVLDLGRDARLGRIEETFGEDPVLAAAFAVAYVTGLQGSGLRSGVAATGKHFAGQGGNQGGHFPGALQAGPRELRHVWAYPFEAAIRLAGLSMVMPGYHAVDGVPCAVNKTLLQELLRGDLGFRGVVVSDYFALKHLREIYAVVDSPGDAVQRTLLAGVDVELPDGASWAALLSEGNAPSRVFRNAVLEACGRVLALKKQLAPEKPRAAGVSRSGKETAREIAREGIVLLENPTGLLPLNPAKLKRVAVLGALADDASALGGDYSWPAAHRWQKHPLDPADLPAVTCLQAIRQGLPGCRVEHASTAREAARAARGADVVIVFLGELAGVTSGEGKDSKDLLLPEEQRELFAKATRLGVPVVTVFLCGRPLPFAEYAEKSGALLVAWYPGEEGGAALAEILLGAVNPSGRLPVSIPRGPGWIPCHYSRHDFTGYGPGEAAYPFGYGLGYSPFSWQSITPPRGATTAQGVRIGVRVRNDGELAGIETVQLYVRHHLAVCARAPWQLKGFARVSLQPGESRRVYFHLPPDLLAEPDEDGILRIDPGRVSFAFGKNSRDRMEPVEVVLSGRERTFRHRKCFFAVASSEKGKQA